jgi:hypothetical protein
MDPGSRTLDLNRCTTSRHGLKTTAATPLLAPDTSARRPSAQAVQQGGQPPPQRWLGEALRCPGFQYWAQILVKAALPRTGPVVIDCFYTTLF